MLVLRCVRVMPWRKAWELLLLCICSLNEPKIKMMGMSWLQINGLSSLNDNSVSELNITWIPVACVLSSLLCLIFSKPVILPAFNGAGGKSMIKLYIQENMVSEKMDNGVVNAGKYLVLNVGRSIGFAKTKF